jgi:DNA-binding MarR family transcriptional regulator
MRASTMSHHNVKILGQQVDAMTSEQAIPYLLKSVHHLLRQAIEERLRQERVDMSFAHFAALYMLESEPGIAGAEIARRCLVTAQTMNTILRRLEKDGDVERRPNPGNSRADSWNLSKTGRSRIERAKIVGAEVWARMLSALKANEVTQLQRLLQKCVQGFDVSAPSAPVRKARVAAKTVRRKAAAAGRGRA